MTDHPMHGMQLWIMGQTKSPDGSVWELGGVFSSREKAVAACLERTDCVFPATVDEVYGRKTEDAPGCFYPLGGTND